MSGGSVDRSSNAGLADHAGARLHGLQLRPAGPRPERRHAAVRGRAGDRGHRCGDRGGRRDRRSCTVRRPARPWPWTRPRRLGRRSRSWRSGSRRTSSIERRRPPAEHGEQIRPRLRRARVAAATPSSTSWRRSSACPPSSWPRPEASRGGRRTEALAHTLAYDADDHGRLLAAGRHEPVASPSRR